MADKGSLPAVAGRYLIGGLCAAAILFGPSPQQAAAASVDCGRVTTFVAPDSAGALNGGDGWLIFAKPDGTSAKVILRSGTQTPAGAISGYVCVGIDGVYFTGLIAPGAAGYVPEPAGSVPGTGVYCGTVAANPFSSGQLSGPRTFKLGGALSGFGIFSVPTSIALPTVGSYLCGRFAVGGPSQLVALLGSSDAGYVPQSLPNTTTAPADATRAPEISMLILIATLAVLALRADRSRTIST
ncbi:MAG TPA: hypothetical protein VL333_06685 [Candidatus Saccharimonadales bacterium]|jgi:hypothetical protein|nr:hypothetical protein [Candidatus Saccharimonadales bacterium]